MLKYKIVEAETVTELENGVDMFLQHGWKLQGGIAVLPQTADDKVGFFQTIIKEVDE